MQRIITIILIILILLSFTLFIGSFHLSDFAQRLYEDNVKEGWYIENKGEYGEIVDYCDVSPEWENLKGICIFIATIVPYLAEYSFYTFVLSSCILALSCWYYLPEKQTIQNENNPC